MRDLNAKIPGAPNFRYREFVYSKTALRHGLNNIPQEEYIWKNIEELAVNVIQPIRKEFGRIRISSGYRSPIVNVKVGGSSFSNHCIGQAADIEPIELGVTLIDIMDFIYDNLEWRWMIAEYFKDGWVHIAYRQKGNIKGIKLKDPNHNFKIVTMEFIRELYN